MDFCEALFVQKLNDLPSDWEIVDLESSLISYSPVELQGEL